MVEVIASGSANELDIAVVTNRLDGLPLDIRHALRNRGIKVVVCRGDVTDSGWEFGDPPRNWPEGKDWDEVPGCFIPASGEVVIATLGDGETRRIPERGEKHGSCDLVFHEVMHADDIELIDNEWRRRSDNTAFVAAWHGDIASGGFAGFAYEAKVAEEGYAESAARFFAEDTSLGHQWPMLVQFWNGTALPVEPGFPAADRRGIDDHHAGSIGTARMKPDGSFELDLVATSDDGIVGHALMVIEPGDPAGKQVAERFDRQRRAMGLDADALILLEPF